MESIRDNLCPLAEVLKRGAMVELQRLIVGEARPAFKDGIDRKRELLPGFHAFILEPAGAGRKLGADSLRF
jgi:hypothetical protein